MVLVEQHGQAAVSPLLSYWLLFLKSPNPSYRMEFGYRQETQHFLHHPHIEVPLSGHLKGGAKPQGWHISRNGAVALGIMSLCDGWRQ